MCGHFFDKGVGHFLSNVVAPVALTAVNPVAGAAYEGIKTGVDTGSPVKGLLGAGGTYVGGKIGSSLASNIGPTLGSSLSSGGDILGSLAGSIGSKTAGMTLGSLAGGAFGANMGGSLAKSFLGSGNSSENPGIPSASPFVAKQQGAMGLPESLSGMSSLAGDQQLSSLANKGVYGGGNGPQENKYFLNQINRQLVDPKGHVSDISSVSPIEQSYLARLGLGGKSNSKSLLEAISKWNPNA